MLAIRLQRTGRSGHAQFRVIVQDSRFSPKRGRVVSYLGNYNPHTKAAVIDSQKAAQYLQNGAQPSSRVAQLFKKEGIKLPAWVKTEEPKKRTVRNPEKRRSTAPAQPEALAATAPIDEPAAEEAAQEGAETVEPEAPSEAAPAAPEAPAEPAADEAKPEEKPSES
jgi:small subunit ribosomal protein S16